MLTFSQIMAILSLLLAFNVPQQDINNVRDILMVKTSPSSALVGGAIITSMESKLPAYTYDGLVRMMYSKIPSTINNRPKPAFYEPWVWPVEVNNISSTTAIIGWKNYYDSWGEIQFEGTTILTKEGNEQPISYEGETLSPHSRTWFQLTGLTPNTVYSYSFVWKETNREDTVITKTFKTLP